MGDCGLSCLLVAPLEALTNPDLTDPERRVLLSLYSFRGKNTDTVWPSLDKLSERSNIKDKTRISKITKSLANKGWLTKKKKGFTGCNEYKLTVPDDANLDSDTKLDGDTKSNLDSDTNSNLDSDTNYKEQTIEQTIEHTSEKPSFEVFWQRYPKKVDKAEARQVFEKLSPDNDLLQTMFRHIESQLELKGWDDPQFIPGPAKFLRRELWENEIYPRSEHETRNGTFDSPADRVRKANKPSPVVF